MKQQIEEIIKKNLPEKMEQTKEESDTEWFLAYGFNQALSQINPSLIADEVLKVVVEKIKEEVEKYEPAYESEDIAIVEFSKQLLNKI